MIPDMRTVYIVLQANRNYPEWSPLSAFLTAEEAEEHVMQWQRYDEKFGLGSWMYKIQPCVLRDSL